MTKTYYINDGEYGPKITPTSAWNDEIQKYIIKNNIKEIELNYAVGWKGKDLSFLAELSDIVAFKIINWNIEDISSIHHLHSLQRLSVSTYCKTEIDFSQFPSLEYCFLEWRPKAKSIFECKSLKYLYINRYSGNDTLKFARLKNLESLRIGNAPIKSLDGLKSLIKLKFLGLYYLRKLTSLDGIETLVNLETLEVDTCRKITSINEIAHLTKLKKLMICNNGDIDSIKPIKSLKNLRSFFFWDSTNILDGYLSPLMELKKLEKVSFQNRRHYTHKKEDFN